MRKVRLVDRAAYCLLRFLLRRRFHGIYVAGKENLQGLKGLQKQEGVEPGMAVVGCCNHTNWWDGFIVHLLSKQLEGRGSYIAQEKKHHARYRFLGWLGPSGIDLDKSPTAGLRYAMRILSDSNNLVWFFPQGHVAHPNTPIVAKGGACFLAKKTHSLLLPVAIRYEWMIESRPSILIKIGVPLPPESSAKELQKSMQALFDSIQPEPGNLSGEFVAVFKPRMSINKKLEYLLHRLKRSDAPFERENR